MRITVASWTGRRGRVPATVGGVSDYSRLIAEGLAEAGDDVHVWCPVCAAAPASRTAMVCLSLGIPIVTTRGHLTEALWRESEAVSLAEVADPGEFTREALRLLNDEPGRRGLGERARRLYDRHFSATRIIDALRLSEGAPLRVSPAIG